MTPHTKYRVCAHPGCGQVQQGNRCTQHTRQADRDRGTTTQRGYGSPHQRLRRQWAPLVATGTVTCHRCRTTIHPRQPWDLGHADHDNTTYTGPEHLTCNRKAAGQAGPHTTPRGSTPTPPQRP